MGVFGFEVEFLTGVSVAAHPHRRTEAEWPPHPDRLFQALVAAWGRNEDPCEEELAALQWLESLPPETFSLSAPRSFPRRVVPVYVPPNDMQTSGRVGSRIPDRDAARSATVVPSLRLNRQERFFPAVIPAAEKPVVYYEWALTEHQVAECGRHQKALQSLVREVVYLGHSHSLVRVALADDIRAGLPSAASDTDNEMVDTYRNLRMPHTGRLAHLQTQYRRAIESNTVVRPRPSLHFHTTRPVPEATLATLFDDTHVIVLADRGGFVPALAAFAGVAKHLRDTLLMHGDPEEPSFLLSGRDEQGCPAKAPHAVLLPLADVGWRYSSGHLLGLAIVFPRTTTDAERATVVAPLSSFLYSGRSQTGSLNFGDRASWSLGLEGNPTRHSLRIDRYFGPARRWATVLPMVLDKHPRERPGRTTEDLIKRACLHIGLPLASVEAMEIAVHRFASVTGAPSANEVRQALAPDSPYRTRPILHATIEFEEKVRGPLLLGAGRFQGLGLCLPLDAREGR
jgi:CRISPR-associated protein Csb2